MRDRAWFSIVHHHRRYRGFYDVVLDWIAANLPQERARFQLRPLPYRLRRAQLPALVVPWLQDPVEAWSQRTYRRALRLESACDQLGIPTLNRVEHLANAGKTEGSQRMRTAGLRTPATHRFRSHRELRDLLQRLPLPCFVREDWGHGRAMLRLDSAQDAAAVKIRRFRRPVVTELIDLRSPADGLYRKFRYVVAGPFGVPHHLQASRDWITRGPNRVFLDATKQEELAYIAAPSPHHELFQHACAALQLDFVAFDYSLDATGQPVVWEANPYPFLQFSHRELVYRNDAIHRTIAVLVAAYYHRAGLPFPPELEQWLAQSPSIRGPHPVADVPIPASPLPPWQIPPVRAPEPTGWQRLVGALRAALRTRRTSDDPDRSNAP